jgi:hypothetical protein
MLQPQPGDFAVIDTGSSTSNLIRLAEWANGDGFGLYDHAVICSRVEGGIPWIVEARPGGAVEKAWHYDGRPVKWSTGFVRACPQAGPAAVRYTGVGYSFLDYFALAAHRLRIPAPDLKAYIGNTGHMICSQLVDQARTDGGGQLFTDGRWPGYVTPMSLADLFRQE